MSSTSISTTQTQRRRRGSDSPDASGWSASLYNKSVPFVYSPTFTAPVLELLAARPGERIIDFGCGSGEVTLEIKRTVEQGDGGVAVGIDYSESMINQAKVNGLQRAYVVDIQVPNVVQDIPEARENFDVVFSNAALHWCKDNPKIVLENARSVLKKGGRLVGEMGGFMNCIGVRAALHHVLRKRGYDPVLRDPWYFPSMEDYVKLLVTASFEPVHLSLTPRLTPLPTGLRGWLQVFARNTFFTGFSDEDAQIMMEEVEDICRIDCQDASGKWAMVYMRLRFCAILK